MLERRIRVTILGRAGVIAPDAVHRIGAQYMRLLEAVAADAERPVIDVVITSDEERRAAAVSAGTRPAFDENRLFHDLVSEIARRSPDAPALVLGDRTVSYAVLNARANQLARFLQRQGVGPDRLVGLCLDRSPEMVMAILGILKAGGAYVPLDPDTLNPGRSGFPAERLLFMLRDTAVDLLVTQADLAAQIPAGACQTVLVDQTCGAFAGYPELDPPCAVTGANLMYAIYTSGSTGRPKAVAVEHRSALNLLHALRQTVYEGAGSAALRVSLNAPVGFDPSVQQLLMLADGHALHLVPGDIRANGRALLGFLRRSRIDTFDCTPSQLRLLLAEGLLDGEGPGRILCGGEALDADSWRRLAGSPRVLAFNLYGPTECTVDSTVARIADAESAPHIGRPLAQVDVLLLDDRLRPVPRGCVGEIFIGGMGVARGYFNRADLTAERFIQGRSGRTSARLYRTGDLARQREDGCFEFIGRLDGQVKVRSHRIELGEIEHLLSEHESIASAVVGLVDGEAQDRRLVAYVQPQLGRKPTSSELRDYLKARVPEYMLPAHFVLVDRFALTENGKIDRTRLPSLEKGRPELGTELLLPRDPLEQRVAAVWSEILEIEEIGVNDTFNDLGGDSLMAVKLFQRLEQMIGAELPAHIFLGHQTVARHAKALGELIGDAR